MKKVSKIASALALSAALSLGAVGAAFADFEGEVFVAGCAEERKDGNIRFAPRFDFSQLLPRARCFVHHGGQNSTMDAFAHAAPQVIVPGRVFERLYNAESVERVGAGVMLDEFTASALREACRYVAETPSFAEESASIRGKLAALGGADRIVSSACVEGIAPRRGGCV